MAKQEKKHQHEWYISSATMRADGTGPAVETCDTCGKTRKVIIEKYK